MRRSLLVLLLLALPAAAQQPGEPVPIRIDSKILGETRTVLVRTPPSYSTGARTYPVLYMTDGDTQLAHTAATADFLVRNGRMPEVIIVGITNTDRTRDLTPTRVERDSFGGNAVAFPTSGGAEKFLAFISTELMPHIEASYRTQPFRVFTGHSFGGLFTIYALTAQPRLFNAWIAVSPTFHWDNQYITRRMADFVKANRQLDSTLVVTVGDEGEAMNGGFAKLKSMLERGSPKGLEVLAVQMWDEDHGSIVLPTHFAALKKIFDPWRFLVAAGDDPLKLYARARDHFAALSKRTGYNVPIPEPTTNLIGYRLLQTEHRTEAIEVFRANVKAYPDSANVYDSLGEALEGAGELSLASENYERAASIGARINDPNTPIYQQNRDRVAKALSEKPRQQSSIDTNPS